MVESTVLICVLEVLTEEISHTILQVNWSITDSRTFVRPHIIAGVSPVAAEILQARSVWQPSTIQLFHARSRDKTYPILLSGLESVCLIIS